MWGNMPKPSYVLSRALFCWKVRWDQYGEGGPNLPQQFIRAQCLVT